MKNTIIMILFSAVAFGLMLLVSWNATNITRASTIEVNRRCPAAKAPTVAPVAAVEVPLGPPATLVASTPTVNIYLIADAETRTFCHVAVSTTNSAAAPAISCL